MSKPSVTFAVVFALSCLTIEGQVRAEEPDARERAEQSRCLQEFVDSYCHTQMVKRRLERMKQAKAYIRAAALGGRPIAEVARPLSERQLAAYRRPRPGVATTAAATSATQSTRRGAP